jgi:hypothetical protein
VRAPGLFALYVAGYSLGRIGEELLRVDPAHHVLGLRLNFFVASALFAVGLVWFLHTQSWLTRRGVQRGGALLAAGALLCLCGCRDSSRVAASAQLAAPVSSALSVATKRVPDWANSVRT